MFGSGGNNPFGGSNPTFGNPTTTPSVFGSGNAAFGSGTTTASVFGSGNTGFGGSATTAGAFGSGNRTFGNTTTTTSIFGSGNISSGTTGNVFGNSGSSAAGSSGGFGSAPSSSAFGTGGANPPNPFSNPSTSNTTPGFGTTPQTTNVFGNVRKPFGSVTGGDLGMETGSVPFGQGPGSSTTKSSTPVFGGSTAFGGGSSQSTTSTPAFGVPKTSTGNVFGGASSQNPGSTPAFGAPKTNTGNVFAGASSQNPVSTPTFGVPKTTAENIFGGATMQGTALTPAFGVQKTTAGNVFGGSTTTNVFGAPVAASTTSQNTFGKPASTVTTASQNVFGKATGPASTATENVFCKPAVTTAPPNVFGNTAASTTSQNIFGKTATPPSTAASNVFGKTTVAVSTASQNIFGKSAESIPPQNVFGKTSATVSTASQNVFGKTAEGSAPQNVFGKTVVSTTPQNVFGSAAPQNVFGKTTAPGSGVSQTVFGKTAAPVTTAPQSVFGKTAESTTAPNVFGKTTAAVTTAPPNIFGKPAASTATSSQKMFGRAASTSDDTSQNPFSKVKVFKKEPVKNLFGKSPAEPEAGPSSDTKPTTLFGKPAKETSSTGQLDKGRSGSSSEDPAKPSGRRIIQRSGITKTTEGKTKGAGLFGRAIANVAENQEPPKVGRRIVVSGEVKEKAASAAPKLSPTSDARTLLRHRSTVDDLSQYTALVAKNVPQTVNNKLTIRKHFSRFGKVSKVFCAPAKSMATVHFEDHESALNAKKNGGVVRQGLPKMLLFWKNLTKSVTSPTTEAPSPQRAKTESAKSTIPKKLFSGPSEVNAELASMSGADSDVFGNEMKVVARPSGLQVDPLAGSVAQPLPSKSRSPDRRREKPAAQERVPHVSRRERARSVSPVGRRTAMKEPAESSKTKEVTREESSSPIPPAAPIVPVKCLIGKRCTTDQERLDVLEARDRALRATRAEMNKGKDLTTSLAIKGTCLDMCPEKERYLRQERRRLTQYEVHPESEGRGLVDHARTVKEYSRSSADQDMPLANELRPPEVLDRTMSYILNNIIKLGGEGKWSDWYEFIWSRTRGIRKDITQQQLCDQTAVALVERCARFHIYCAERLCEEDAAVFDMKINDENLTKCLQTLKELYHDLATKHNQHCPNEAEFRAYIVLMNLNQGDILRETQQLRSEIRESAQVKFALSVYSALYSNNYIRFFKLVHCAPFLNACIMHRYFNQMRSSALLTMCMAYSLPGKTAQIPVTDVVRLLGFEDDEEASSFSEEYGFPTEKDGISMLRNNYMEPETAIRKRRAIMLIESKLTTSAGEAIHGGPLPPNEIPEPTSSFDFEGRFCPDGATLQIVQREEEGEVKETPIPVQEVDTEKPSTSAEPESETQPSTKHPFSNDAVKAVAKEMFLEIIGELCQDMSQNLVQTCREFLGMDSPLTEGFLDHHVPLLLREIVTEVIKEARDEREREARARAELSILREKIAGELQSEVTEETIQRLALNIAQEEKREADHQLKEESKERCSAAYISDLLHEVLTRETDKLTAEFYEQEVVRKRQVLAQAAHATRLRRVQHHFLRWKNKLASRQRLKRSMLDFPAAPSMHSPRERLQRILPESKGFCETRNAVHLGNKAWLTLTPPNVVVENENQLIQEILRQNEEARQKLILSRSSIDLCRLVGPLLIKNRHQNQQQNLKGRTDPVYWKLLVSLPEPITGEEEDYHDWLVNKLSTPDDDFPPEIHHPVAQVIGRSSGIVKDEAGQPVSVNVAVRQVTGVMTDTVMSRIKQQRHLQATNAVLFVVGRYEAHYTQVWKTERTRLSEILSLYKRDRISLIIIATPGLVGECRSNLSDLCQGLSFYQFVPFSTDVVNPATTLQVQESLELLVSHSCTDIPLQAEYLTDYLEHGLQRFFYSKLQNSTFSDNPEHCLDQVPNEVIELYNAAIVHLGMVVSVPELRDVSWPPTEFCHSNKDLPPADWNSEESSQYMSRLLNTLTLPLNEGAGVDDDWDDACHTLWQYVKSVASETDGTDVFLVTRVRKLLQQKREMYEDQCMWMVGVDDVEPGGCDVPWSRIIRLCIDHKLSFLNTLSPDGNQSQLDYNEIRVFYKAEDMNSFEVPDEWLSVCRQSPDHSTLERSIRRSVKRKQDKLHSETPETTPKSKRLSPIKMNQTQLDLEPVDPELLEVQVQAGDLMRKIAVERKAMDDYEKYLEDLIKEGEVPLLPLTRS